MSIDSLRKRLKEQLKNGTLDEGYTAPELPGMGDPYQPPQPPVDTYNPPKSVVPATPKTTPISTNTKTNTTPISTPTTNTAKNTSVPSTPSSAKNSSQTKVDPKSGEAGSKALDDILKDDTRFFKMTMNERLAEAYNAGYYGMDISRDVRDDAAAGDYLDSIEAMYNAGKQDSSMSKNVDDFNPEKVDNTENSGYDLSTEAARQEQLSQKSVHNQGKSDYTAGNTTGNTNTTGNAKTTGSTNAENDTDSEEVLRMGDVEYPQGDAEESQQEEGEGAAQPAAASTQESKTSGNTVNSDLGEAGNKILNEIEEESPLVFFKKNTSLLEAYNAGLNGVDISKELKENASAGGYWDAVWSMYEAGEADSKAGSGDQELERTEDLGYNEKDLNPWGKDFEYIKNMMFLNGAGSSENPDIQALYQYFTSPDNQNKQIPQEILNVFENFKNNINGEQKTRTSEIASRRLGDSSKDYSYKDIKARNKFFGYPTAGGHMTVSYHGSDVKGGGIDIGGLDVGEPVYAVEDGTVEYFVYYMVRGDKTYYCSYGLYAKLIVKGSNGQDHYIYAHLDPNSMFDNGLVSDSTWEGMRKGMQLIQPEDYNATERKPALSLGSRQIKKGEVIGYLGQSGNSRKGRHLHFGWFPGGVNVNPLENGFSNYRE